MKTIKFRSKLIPSILDGSKISTWRLFDDKNLQTDDEVELINWETGEIFAHACIIEVREKKLGDITDADFSGHAPYKNQEEMLNDFRQYYGDRVTLQSTVKIIQFAIKN